MEKIKIRGLTKIAGWVFVLWGTIVSVKGIYDAFWGEPESNFYSLSKWEFISKKQWFNWSGFEVAYGFSCVGLALLLWEFSKRLPEYVERKIIK